jgi:hypothetical protein
MQMLSLSCVQKSWVAILGMCSILSGCALSLQGAPWAETSRQQEISRITGMTRRFISIRQVYSGMTRQEAASVLSQQVVIGYELSDERNQQYKPIVLQNPFRSETLTKNGKEFLVDYYVVGIQTPDGQVSDDELVPLVFFKDKLIGTGWLFLNQEIKSQQGS